MSFDPSCYDLAVHFLSDNTPPGSDTEANRQELAQEIQNAVEDFFFLLEEERTQIALFEWRNMCLGSDKRQITPSFFRNGPVPDKEGSLP